MNQSEEDKRKVILLAQQIVQNEVRPLLGVRRLVPHLHDLGLQDDERFIRLRGIDSESNHLPLDLEVRNFWNRDALECYDTQALEYEERCKDDILAMCHDLIQELAPSSILQKDLRDAYKSMAQDKAREVEALEFSEATISDVADENIE